MNARVIVGRAFGVISGIALIGFLLIIPFPFLLILLFVTLWHPEGSPVSVALLSVPCLLLGLFAGGLPAIALARFALRVWPLNESGTPRKRCVRWQRFVAYSVTVLLGLAILGGLIGPGLKVYGMYTLPLITGWTAWGTAIAGGAMLSSWAHAHPKYFRVRPFILYLRRFSSFADRTVIAEILRAAPRRVPVVFIASPEDRPGNWDLFVWSFSGMRLTDPRATIPVQFRTPNLCWEEAVGRLISEAAFVVVDVTEVSESLETEARLVAQHASPERVLWLRGPRSVACGEESDLPIDPEHVLVYRRRWAVWGLVGKLAAFGFFGYLCYLILGVTYWHNQFTLASILGLIFFLCASLVLGALMVFRPSIDRAAREGLRRMLGLASSGSPSY